MTTPQDDLASPLPQPRSNVPESQIQAKPTAKEEDEHKNENIQAKAHAIDIAARAFELLLGKMQQEQEEMQTRKRRWMNK